MSKFMKAGLLGFLVLGLGVSPALAGKGGKKDPEQRFKKLDTNGDGALSLQEMKGKGKKEGAKIEKRFQKLDKNSDGKLSLAELKGRTKKKNKSA
jgi:hypothetical protein